MGGAARGCGSTQPGVRGGRLWLVQKFKTPLKVTLGSNHTHPYSEKGSRSCPERPRTSPLHPWTGNLIRSAPQCPSPRQPEAPLKTLMLLCGKILWQPQPRGLEGAQCSCKADLLFCLQPQVEVLGCLEDEHDVELRLNSPRGSPLCMGMPSLLQSSGHCSTLLYLGLFVCKS